MKEDCFWRLNAFLFEWYCQRLARIKMLVRSALHGIEFYYAVSDGITSV